MQMLVSAWNAVSTKTIENCSRKAEISTANKEATIANENYPLKDMRLQNEIDTLIQNIKIALVPKDVNAASSTNVDAEVSAVHPPLPDSNIFAEFFETVILVTAILVTDVSDGLGEEPGNLTSFLH